jgi:hypothetical protein
MPTRVLTEGYIVYSRDAATDGISLCSWSTTKFQVRESSSGTVAASARWSARVAPPEARTPVSASWPPDRARAAKVPGRSLTYV